MRAPRGSVLAAFVAGRCRLTVGMARPCFRRKQSNESAVGAPHTAQPLAAREAHRAVYDEEQHIVELPKSRSKPADVVVSRCSFEDIVSRGNGEWVNSGTAFDTFNPANEEKIATCYAAGPAEVDAHGPSVRAASG